MTVTGAGATLYGNDSEADVDRTQQAKMADRFRERHHTAPVLLLPNVWDALSARLFALAGFDALATSSAGVAWALLNASREVAGLLGITVIGAFGS